MAYVVSKWQEHPSFSQDRWPLLSRKAFDTREELLTEFPAALDALEEGMTPIGGDVHMTVEPVEMTELLGDLIGCIIDSLVGDDDKIIDAFNEREDR